MDTHYIRSAVNSHRAEPQLADDETTWAEVIFPIIGTMIAVLFVSWISVIMALA